jgi:hypothetical protein
VTIIEGLDVEGVNARACEPGVVQDPCAACPCSDGHSCRTCECAPKVDLYAQSVKILDFFAALGGVAA